MKKALKILFGLILIFLFIVIIPKLNLTGKIILENYSYTKAICNESNYCEDYVVECLGKELKKFYPMGFAIQQNKNWIDEREERRLCG
jgi:hypothetical protein